MKFGNTEIGGMSFGSIRIGGAKFGDKLVFSPGGGPTPSLPKLYGRLVFDGTAYINTGLFLPENGSIRTYVRCSGARAQGFFSANAVIDGANSSVLLIRNTATGNNGIYYGKYDSKTDLANGGTIALNSHLNFNIWITPKAFAAGDKIKTFTRGSTPPTSQIYIAPSSTNRFKGAMETFYIYDSAAANVTTLNGFSGLPPVYTLRPCMYNGQCGYWVVETGTFLGNSNPNGGTLSVEGESGYFLNRNISIIGDSISTYNDPEYKYDSYPMYYPLYDVTNVNLTYWKKLMLAQNATLEVNLSYSGGTVATRSGYLSLCDRVPLIGSCDTVIIALGTNDSANQLPLGDYSYGKSIAELDETYFREAYIKGIKMIKEIDSTIEIVCAIFSMGADYRNSIIAIAQNYGLKVVDCGNDYAKCQGVHPSAAGMEHIFNNFLYL